MSPLMVWLLVLALCAALLAGFPVAFTLAGVSLRLNAIVDRLDEVRRNHDHQLGLALAERA